MLKELKNEAKISFLLHTVSPLMIKSPKKKVLDPTAIDMSCIKSRYQGKDSVMIPGSSLKGVIRSRYEKIVKLFGGICCNIFSKENPCENLEESIKSWGIYNQSCSVCRLFGSTKIASRIYFADAYPVGECILGERKGVGINRITGAAQKKVLYDFEVVEDGTFQVWITLKNYEIYQLLLVLYTLQDLNEGYISLGAASTRGYGRLEVKDPVIFVREFRKNVEGLKDAYGNQEIFPGNGFEYQWKVPFYGESKISTDTLENMIVFFHNVNIEEGLGGNLHA